MNSIILIIIPMLTTSLGERNLNNTNWTEESYLRTILQSLLYNITNNTVYSPETPTEMYFNYSSAQKPTQDITSLLNVTGLDSEEMAIVMAFPHFTEDNNTFEKSNDSLKNELISVDNTSKAIPIINETENYYNFSGRQLENERLEGRMAFLNPLNWFRRPTTTTTISPPVIYNYYLRPQSPQTQTQYLGLPVVYRQKGQVLSKPNANKVGTPVADSVPELQNIVLSGAQPNYPTLPLIPLDRPVADPQQRPEYPSNDIRPPVLEVVYQ